MKSINYVLSVVIFVLGVAVSPASHAVKASYLFSDSMTDGEAARFVGGMVSMLTYMQYSQNQVENGKCIDKWYFQTDGTAEEVLQYMFRYQDRHAEAILYVLAKKACFNEDGS